MSGQDRSRDSPASRYKEIDKAIAMFTFRPRTAEIQSAVANGEADLGIGFDFTKDSNLKVLARAVGKLGAVHRSTSNSNGAPGVSSMSPSANCPRTTRR
jgi:hypothetical protein